MVSDLSFLLCPDHAWVHIDTPVHVLQWAAQADLGKALSFRRPKLLVPPLAYSDRLQPVVTIRPGQHVAIIKGHELGQRQWERKIGADAWARLRLCRGLSAMARVSNSNEAKVAVAHV